MRFLDILRQERAVSGISHMFLTGVPTVIAYHISDWAAFFVETMVDSHFEDGDSPPTERQEHIRTLLHTM